MIRIIMGIVSNNEKCAIIVPLTIVDRRKLACLIATIHPLKQAERVKYVKPPWSQAGFVL